MSPFGRLTQLKLRDHWTDEAGDFTPWLAEEENIALVGDSIGMDLEVEAQEQSVGPFRADILCRDTDTDKLVLIENQLEPTDHRHLGQLLTYAAGLDTVTIVWIAKSFTEEHRAALDWLNKITDEAFSFFGLEIELWQIGDSAVAPKLNMISHPNDWQRTINRAVQKRLTATNELYLEYWTALKNHFEGRNNDIKFRKPLPQNWTNFAVGRSGFHLTASASRREEYIGVYLTVHGTHGKSHFDRLKMSQTEIESEIGAELEWDENPKENYIGRYLEDTDLEDRDDWQRQHQWLCEQLETFHRVFAPRVKALDASDSGVE